MKAAPMSVLLYVVSLFYRHLAGEDGSPPGTEGKFLSRPRWLRSIGD